MLPVIHDAAEKELPELEEILKRANAGEIDINDGEYPLQVGLLLQSLRSGIINATGNMAIDDEYSRVLVVHQQAVLLGVGNEAASTDYTWAMGVMVDLTRQRRPELYAELPDQIKQYGKPVENESVTPAFIHREH